MDSVEEEERFRAKLERLAKMSPEAKRRHARQIDEREKRFAEDHATMSRDISERRAFEDEARNDENWNHDQPL